MTVVSLFRLCDTGTSKFMHHSTLGMRDRTWQHICCWGIPLAITTIMVLVSLPNGPHLNAESLSLCKMLSPPQSHKPSWMICGLDR